MADQQAKIFDGEVLENLPNAFFKIKLSDGREILGYLSGKMRLNRIRLLPGDKVRVEMNDYSVDRGRVVNRLR
jgi:translation initiation factor IF-1